MENLKLNSLAKNKLEKKELCNTTGGHNIKAESLCGCGCRYADNGGSSTNDNACANADGGMR